MCGKAPRNRAVLVEVPLQDEKRPIAEAVLEGQTLSVGETPDSELARENIIMKCIFSIDVEEWYHILDLPSTPKIGDWDSFPSRVESNFANF